MDNQHVDGWNSDEVFRSMRRNCEAYKKMCQENEQLKKEIVALKKELGRGDPELKTWNDYILYVLRDGKQRTAKEIFNIINGMDQKPFPPEAKTPVKTCGSICGTLFTKNMILKTNDTPIKYFVLLS